MALGATNVLVGAAQRELGSLLVVEQRRLPLHAGVAFGASCGVTLGKLLAVNVLVAIFALSGRSLEVYVHQLGFKVWWLVTIDAGGRAMRAQ